MVFVATAAQRKNEIFRFDRAGKTFLDIAEQHWVRADFEKSRSAGGVRGVDSSGELHGQAHILGPVARVESFAGNESAANR